MVVGADSNKDHRFGRWIEDTLTPQATSPLTHAIARKCSLKNWELATPSSCGTIHAREVPIDLQQSTIPLDGVSIPA